MTAPASALYAGRVVHRRLRPRRHKLGYRVFSLLLDLDELPALDGRLRLFGVNRRRPVSFHECDHGAGTGSLRAWVEDQLRSAGITPDGGAIRLLCYPRVLGYVFNPIAVYYCHARSGALQAILYEVRNTYGEKHTYIAPARLDPDGLVRHSCTKAFHVSPFLPETATYHFRLALPGRNVAVSILETDAGGPLLTAVFAGTHKPLTDAALARALLAYPLMTLKVTGAIYWQAVRLRLKGLRFAPHRAKAGMTGTSSVAITEPWERAP